MTRSATGERFAVVTGHSLATRVALDLLEQGADLIDAAVAASALLAVVSTHANSIGSDGFALIRRGGKVFALNASGTAPAAALPERFPDTMPDTGCAAAVVPGLPALWDRLHARWGRLAWGDLLEAATAAAQAHPVSAVLKRNLDVERARVGSQPGFAGVYGQAPASAFREGMLRQPALASTLHRLARQGSDAFYRGEVAHSLCASVARAGGLLRPTDLASFAPRWCDPIRSRYGPLDLFAFGENAFGVLGLLQLAVLERIGRPTPEMDPADRLDLLMRVAFASLEAVQPRIADPEQTGDAARALLSEPTIASVAAAARLSLDPLSRPTPGGTTGLVVADRNGDAIVILQSNFQPFGCGHIDEQTGILLNNRMLCFSTRPGDLNQVGPGRRPAHTHHPVIIERDGVFEAAFASPGGISQTITGTQLIVNRYDLGQPPAQAISSARWSTNRHGDKVLEDEIDESIASRLVARGHRIARARGSNFFGSVKSVWRQPDGRLLAQADHRREASAGAS